MHFNKGPNNANSTGARPFCMEVVGLAEIPNRICGESFLFSTTALTIFITVTPEGGRRIRYPRPEGPCAMPRVPFPRKQQVADKIGIPSDSDTLKHPIFLSLDDSFDWSLRFPSCWACSFVAPGWNRLLTSARLSLRRESAVACCAGRN